MKKTSLTVIAAGAALALLFSWSPPVGAQGRSRLVTLERALGEGTVKLGVQGLGPDRIRVNLQSLLARPLEVLLPRGSLFGPPRVFQKGRSVNRVQEMATLREERIELGPKALVSRDLPAVGLDLWARYPLPHDVLSYRPRKKIPGGEGLFRILQALSLPWEARQAAFWILIDDARYDEANRSRRVRPGDPRPKPIPPLAFAAGMMAFEMTGRSLGRRRCARDAWVLVPAARPRLFPSWARRLSAWALEKLHARGHGGDYLQVIRDILRRDPDQRICLEAFKAAASFPSREILAAMKACLVRFPRLPSERMFSPWRVYRALCSSAGRSLAAPPGSGGGARSPRAGLDTLLAEIRGGGPGSEQAFAALAERSKEILDPQDRIRVGRTLAECLKEEFPFGESSFVRAAAAFRDTLSLGFLFRIFARRGEARGRTRRVWVKLVALYPDWAATRWILDRLSDPDRQVRGEAVGALRKRPDAVGPLLDLALHGDTLRVRLAALDALAVPWGARNVPLRRAVSRLLEDPSDRIRSKALEMLASWRCREFLPRMIALCADDPSLRVRWAAARALRLLGDRGTAAKIRTLLASPGSRSRELRWALAGLSAR